MASEEQHLRESDRHIADSERRITWLEQHLASLKAARSDTTEAERLLANVKSTLIEMYEHRRMINERLTAQDASPAPKH